MLRRFFRWTVRGFLILFALLVLFIVGSFLWLRESLPDLDARYELAGIDKPVTVLRDESGIPHIYAATMRDAYFALGFVHAQDRLFQMVMQRRIGQGRLSELIGSMGLPADKLMRTLGLYRQAKTSVAALKPGTRAGLEAYAAGVNAYIRARKELLPPEFNVLLHKPEPWTPADSVLWGKLMALQLSSNWRSELNRLAIVQLVGADRARELFPGYPKDGPTTHSLRRLPPVDRLIAAIPWSLVGNGASNQWVVAGSRTASGKPILANDPHLGMTVPPLWYLVRIVTPEMEITGATVPGVPLHLVGHNGHLAWGVTTPYVDTADLFIEQIDPKDPKKYVTPTGTQPFVTRTETIEVRFGKPVTLTVRETRHGPVISDLSLTAGPRVAPGQVLALQAPWLTGADTTADAILDANRARDWPAFREALRRVIGPSQNFVVADTKGTIAHITPGRIPIRKTGDGGLPVPGWDGTHDWIGYIPFDLLPQGSDPTKGFIVNANNRIVGPGYPFFLTLEWGDHYRATRITDVLSKTPKSTVDTTAALQGDTLSTAALAILPELLKTPPQDETGRQALSLLSRWDGRMDRHRPEPLIFMAFVYELGLAVFSDELGLAQARRLAFDTDLLRNVLLVHTNWCDNSMTAERESCSLVQTQALVSAMARLKDAYGGDPADWRWGRAHRLSARHPVFGFVPVLSDFTGLRLETGGGNKTVNKAAATGREPHPFSQGAGPGLRAIMPLDDLSKSRFIVAGGPSGNPYSPFFDNLLLHWRDIRYVAFTHDRTALARKAAGKMTLVPASAAK